MAIETRRVGLRRARGALLDLLGGLHATGAEASAFRYGRRRVLYLATPAGVGELLTTRDGSFRKVTAVAGGRLLTVRSGERGPLLGSDDGRRHRQARRVLQEAFRPARLEEHARVVAEECRAWVAALPADAPVDVVAPARELTAEVTARALFAGVPLRPADVARDLDVLFDGYRLFTAPLESLRRPGRLAAAAGALGRVRRTLAAAHGGHVPDGVGPLLDRAARDSDLPPLAVAPERLVADTTTIFAAGSEPLAAALAWMLGALAGRADVAAGLRAEVDALGGPPEADPAALVRCRAVFAETLRLYPPSWFLAREATTATELLGRAVAPGTIVLASPYHLHRDPRLWDEPDAFRPERWLEGTAARGHSFVPFGAGGRKCIGERLAYLQGTLLAAVLTATRLPAAAGPLPAPRPAVSLRPAGPVRILLPRRA